MLFSRSRRALVSTSGPARARSRRTETRQAGRSPQLELLETRDLPSVLTPTYVLAQPADGVTPFSSSGSTVYTPAQVRHAYGFDQVSFSNGAVKGDGSGEAIAVVDSYDDPNIAADLHAFDQQFGLADPTFTKVNQNGGSTLPSADTGWAQEISLDVEWAHAIAPKANLLLVEANDSSTANLFQAVSYAANQPGVVAVSMSWGGGEWSSEASADSTFRTPAGHPGVAFLASSGDSGSPVSYPAASPNVLAVGGTSLYLDASGNYAGESGWSGSGGGASAYEAQPAYQQGQVSLGGGYRTNPDVSYDADPSTGYWVYDSYGTSQPWGVVGGTSAAAPQWAALVAIADQGRALQGKGSLDTATQLLPMLYQLPASDFHDVTSGVSLGVLNLNAGVGYDLVTGRGSPVANLVVAGLVGTSTTTTPTATHFRVSAPSNDTAGTPVTVTVTALDANNNVVAGYAGTVHFTSTDAQAVLPANVTLSNGTGSVSATFKTAGTESLTATDTSTSTITGTATGITVAPAAATHLVFGQQPTGTTVGAAINPAVTVQVVDAYGNLVTSDSTDKVTLALGANPGGATLAGTTTVTVSGGVATFGNLSLAKTGTGYTLAASSGGLTGATSAAFNVTAATSVLENFEGGSTWYVAGAFSPTAYLSTAAAHDGTYGLDDYDGTDWLYRTDAAAQVKQGQSISVWVQFANAADGRAYFGFGASAAGTLSLVAAPNTGQLLLQDNSGYTNYTVVGAVNQAYQANHWYRLEVDWGTGGSITGKLFDSNGTTLLNAVTAVDNSVSAGGIAFRARGSDKYFDTVTISQGVSPPAVAETAPASPEASGPRQAAPRPEERTAVPVLSAHAVDRLFVARHRRAAVHHHPTHAGAHKAAEDVFGGQ